VKGYSKVGERRRRPQCIRGGRRIDGINSWVVGEGGMMIELERS
jgi:hypothetical protein